MLQCRHALPARHRRLLLLGAAASLALPALASSRRVLQPMTEGPFYPPRAWRQRWADWDADLTRVVQDGQTLTAQGEHLGLAAVVADTRGRVIDGAEVEIWQCDVLAHYRHPRVPQQAGGFDPGFQGLGWRAATRPARCAFAPSVRWPTRGARRTSI
jgi:protocatechuate 3,4-dioxygenase beta subunit